MRSTAYSLCLLTVLAVPGLAEGPSKAELSKLGKAAAVYIESGRGSGSGFCIHGSGLFVTNAHVVGGQECFQSFKIAVGE